MSTSGNCSLVIRGHELNFKEIEENLKIKPSRIIKKGQVVSEVIGESEFDIWVLEIKFKEEEIPNNILAEVISVLTPYKVYIQGLSKWSDVRIKCYVQSKYAQINFELYPNVINELSSMGIKLEISILSWGGVKSL